MTEMNQHTPGRKKGRRNDSDAPVALTGKGGAENLKPCRTRADAQERGRAGGIASGSARRERRALRELLTIALEMPDATGSTNAEAIVAALIDKARGGDVRAFETIRDSIGEKPTTAIDHTSSDGSIAAAVFDLSGYGIAELMELTREAFRHESADPTA